MAMSEQVRRAIELQELRKDRNLLQGQFEGTYTWASDMFDPGLTQEVQPDIRVLVTGKTYPARFHESLPKDAGEAAEELQRRMSPAMEPREMRPRASWRGIDFDLITELTRPSSDESTGPSLGIGISIGMRKSEGTVAAEDGLSYLDVDRTNCMYESYGRLFLKSKPESPLEWTLMFEAEKWPVSIREIPPKAPITSNTIVICDASPAFYLATLRPREYELHFDGIQRGGGMMQSAVVKICVSYPGTLGGDPEISPTDIEYDRQRLISTIDTRLDWISHPGTVDVVNRYEALQQNPTGDKRYSRQLLFDAFEAADIELPRQQKFDLVVAYEGLERFVR